MNSIRMKNIFYYLIFAAALVSCGEMEEPIDWDTKNIPEKLIVEGWLTNQSDPHEITLKTTADYFSGQALPVVSDAEVAVTGNGQTYEYAEVDTLPGTYRAVNEYAGVKGIEYQLNISLPKAIDGTINYTAKAPVIEGMRIDSGLAEMYENPFSMDEEDSVLTFVVLYGQEPGDIENYYLIKYFRNGQQLNDSVNVYTIFNDYDQEANGKDYMILGVDYELVDGDTLSLELYSISKNFYHFVTAAQQISYPADPMGFQGPPANAVGNINEGKGLGYFTGAYMSRVDIIVKDKR
jgi:hypothetical protein